MRRRIPLLLPLLLVAASLLRADDDPIIDNAFATFLRDNAVLQRDCPLPIWGTATPGSRVVLFVNGDLYQTTSSPEGSWRVTLPPQPPSSHNRLTLVVEGEPIQSLHNIAFGDLWLCAGAEEIEANFFHNIHRANEELQDTDLPDLRVLVQAKRTLYQPADSLGPDAFWAPCNPDFIRHQSVLGVLFARNLHRKLGVPIGIIQANFGGSPNTAWLSLQTALSIPELTDEARERQDAIHTWTHGGEAAFYATQHAWDNAYDGSDPYANADILPCDDDFVEDAQWVQTEIPRTLEDTFDSPDYDGFVWYRRTIYLSADQTKKQATLCLDHVDDEDTTWFNGGQIGNSNEHRILRQYPIPQAALRTGPNLIAIRVRDTGNIGGLCGDPKNIGIFFDDHTSIDLTQGLWSCRANKIPKGPRPVDPMYNVSSIASCYNSLIHPLAGMPIRGILWASSLSQFDRTSSNTASLQAIIQKYQNLFPSPSAPSPTPFLIYQHASHYEHHNEPYNSPLASLRWDQMRLSSSLSNVFTIVTLDDGNPYLPISSNKRLQANRFTATALKYVYNLEPNSSPESPYPTSATRTPTHIRVNFKTHAPLSTSNQKPPASFQLLDDSGTSTLIHNASLQDTSVLLPIPENIPHPTLVRYAWDDFPIPDANLIGANQHPVGSFQLPIP